MADKQATVYVVDLGECMGHSHNGRSQTDLDYLEGYLWDRITSTVSNGRKTDTICVIGLRTNESDNALATNDGNYRNLSVITPMSQFLMPQIRLLKQALKPSTTNAGDGISAIVLAIDIIEKYCKKLKYIRNIVLLTNGRGSFDFDGVDEIAKQIREQNINLTVLGVDFDDADFGFTEPSKDPLKAETEDGLKQLCEECNGIYGTLAEAIQELGRPRMKRTRPVASFKGQLSIGDEEGTFDSSLLIDVERYPRTMVAKAPSASSFAAGSDLKSHDPESTSSKSNLQRIITARTYQVDDESAPGKAVDVHREDMAKGYTYGRTIVPISAEDQEIVKFETASSLRVIGFLPKTNFERHLGMSNSNIIVASKVNSKSILSLSSFVHALYELDSIALARLVVKADKPPIMLALFPVIESESEYLVDAQLPFAEDVRQYKFAPLDSVKTITGKTLDIHRFIPNEELQEAMNDFVDALSLTGLSGVHDESLLFAHPDDTFSPVLHRINQVIRSRAVLPSQNILPEISPALLSYSRMPRSLIQEAEEDIKRLKKTGNIRPVPPKAKGKRGGGGGQAPISGLDVGSLLHDRISSGKIDKANSIPEFKQMMEVTKESGDIGKTIDQMALIVKDIIRESVADLRYDQAIECLKALRQECIDCEASELYDEFVKDLKVKLLGGELSGDRKDFWSRLRKEKLGLVGPGEEPRSKLSSNQINQFYYDSEYIH